MEVSWKLDVRTGRKCNRLVSIDVGVSRALRTHRTIRCLQLFRAFTAGTTPASPAAMPPPDLIERTRQFALAVISILPHPAKERRSAGRPSGIYPARGQCNTFQLPGIPEGPFTRVNFNRSFRSHSRRRMNAKPLPRVSPRREDRVQSRAFQSKRTKSHQSSSAAVKRRVRIRSA